MEEKRRSERFQINQLVQLDFMREEFISAEGINISGHGLLCRTAKALPLGQRVFLMLNLGAPGSKNYLSLEGAAARCQQEPETGKFICAIEFVDLDEENRERILALFK